MRKITGVTFLVFVLLVVAACGTSKGSEPSGAPSTSDPIIKDSQPKATVVVTTVILGDVVEQLVGEVFNVVTIMPNGVSPHDFQASARQVETMQTADLLVVNGGGFEEGLLKVVNTASDQGVPIFRALDHAQALSYDTNGHDHHHEDDIDQADEPHSHTSGLDPHFFTDPARMVLVGEALLDDLAEFFPQGIDADVRLNAQNYLDELRALDEEVAEALSVIPNEARKMVTNHGVFGYFANRYNLEIIDTIIPGGGLSEGVGAERLARLVQTMKAEEISVVFVDRGASDRFAKVLQGELPGLEIVKLHSETLGEPGSDADTYINMIRSNATAIAQALGN